MLKMDIVRSVFETKVSVFNYTALPGQNFRSKIEQDRSSTVIMTRKRREVSPFRGTLTDEPVAKRLRPRQQRPPPGSGPLPLIPTKTSAGGDASSPSLAAAGTPQLSGAADTTNAGRTSPPQSSRSPTSTSYSETSAKLHSTRYRRRSGDSTSDDGHASSPQSRRVSQIASPSSDPAPSKRSCSGSDSSSASSRRGSSPAASMPRLEKRGNWYEPVPPSCEDVERYCPGGYLPVHVGERLAGRYTITAKLGYGGSSTVFLVWDNIANQYCAAKIYTADRTEEIGEAEVRMYEELRGRLSDADAERFLVPLLDNFYEIHEAGGEHLCLIFGLTGPTLADLRHGKDTLKLRPDYLRRIARQMVEAVGAFHKAGMTWSDLNPGNIALKLIDIKDWTPKQLFENLGSNPRYAVQPSPEYAEQSKPYMPRYVLGPLDFSRSDRWQYLVPEIKCLDFADSFFDLDQYPLDPTIDYMIQPGISDPETHFWGQHPVHASDIWSVACLIFEIRSGEHLFDYHEFENDELECAHLATIGPPPPAWANQFSKRMMVDAETGSPVDRDRDYVPPWKARLVEKAPRSRLDRLRALLLVVGTRLRALQSRCLPCPHSILRRLTQMMSCSCGECPRLQLIPVDVQRPWSASDTTHSFVNGNRWIELAPGHRTLRWRIDHIGVDADSTMLDAGEVDKQLEAALQESARNGSVSSAAGSSSSDSAAQLAPRQCKLSAREADDFEELLLMMLTWYRRDRATLEEVLAMPWLSSDMHYYAEVGVKGEPWLQPCEPAPRMGNIYRKNKTPEGSVEDDGEVSSGAKSSNHCIGSIIA